jgi:predicted lactoylglutathione lyase
MAMERLFAGLPVSDFPAAVAWYSNLFDRKPDVVAHEHEVLWQVAGTSTVYVIKDDERAGKSLIAILVTNLESMVDDLGRRGISMGPIEQQGDAAYKATATDPDGNSISFIQVAGG